MHASIKEGQFYKCNECDYFYTDKHKLDQHKKTHSKEKSIAQLKCEECNKNFVKGSSFKNHKFTHLDE